MGKLAKALGLAAIGCGLALPVQSADASLVLSIVDRGTGLSSATRLVGETIELDLVVASTTAPGGDVYQLAQFDVNFSDPDLIFNSYLWDPDTAAAARAFDTGSGDDQTIPILGSLPLSIGAGSPFPTSADIDIRFDNLAREVGGIVQNFEDGVLLSFQFEIPLDFLDPSGDKRNVVISPEGVAFRLGFFPRTVSGNVSFDLNVIPEPVTLALLGVGGLVGIMRRRR